MAWSMGSQSGRPSAIQVAAAGTATRASGPRFALSQHRHGDFDAARSALESQRLPRDIFGAQTRQKRRFRAASASCRGRLQKFLDCQRTALGGTALGAASSKKPPSTATPISSSGWW